MQPIWKLLAIIGLLALGGFMLPLLAYIIPIALGISAVLMVLKVAAYVLFGRSKKA